MFKGPRSKWCACKADTTGGCCPLEAPPPLFAGGLRAPNARSCWGCLCWVTIFNRMNVRIDDVAIGNINIKSSLGWDLTGRQPKVTQAPQRQYKKRRTHEMTQITSQSNADGRKKSHYLNGSTQWRVEALHGLVREEYFERQPSRLRNDPHRPTVFSVGNIRSRYRAARSGRSPRSRQSYHSERTRAKS